MLELDAPRLTQRTLGLTGKRKNPAFESLPNSLELEILMTNQLMVKTQRFVSSTSLVILLAVAPVVVGQSPQGPAQQATGATPTYGPGSDNKPIVKQHPNPATKSTTTPSAAAVKNAGVPGETKTAKGSTGEAKRLAPGTFQLQVTKNDFGLPFISLKANRARASEIAVALERELNTSVVLSPLMKQLRATLEFEEVPLQTALGLLAPEGYIDTGIVTGRPGDAPLLVEIYLGAANEPAPPPSGAAKSVGPQAFVVSGDTEASTDNPSLEEAKKRLEEKEKDGPAEGVKAEEDDPIFVKYDQEKKLITVRARKVPMTGVLYEIAEKLGIVFELGTIHPDIKILSEVVDKNLNEYTVLDALRALSPEVVVYMRTDIHGVEPVPMRLALELPPEVREKLGIPAKQEKASAGKNLQN